MQLEESEGDANLLEVPGGFEVESGRWFARRAVVRNVEGGGRLVGGQTSRCRELTTLFALAVVVVLAVAVVGVAVVTYESSMRSNTAM